MAFLLAMLSAHHRFRTLSFWDAQARWQQRWLEHCSYHREILARIKGCIAPGWKVLDIGAGSGVLALPLGRLGCRVTALEPSRGMRALLRQAAGSGPGQKITVEGRSWEEMPLARARGFHLILACNSLQATSWGVAPALAKIFAARPRHVCLISETDFVTAAVDRCYGNYRLCWQESLTTDSSMAYASLTEAWEHFRHCWGRPPTRAEKAAIRAELTCRQQLYWLPQESRLGIWWWSREAGGKEKNCGAKVRHTAFSH